MLKFDWNILWTLINLVFFFFLMKFTLFKPIKKVLDKRQELLDEQFEDAKKTQDEANSIKAEYQSQLDGVDDERKQIIADARDSAKVEYDKILERADNEAQRIKTEAQRNAKAETEKARLSAKEQIASIAMETAAKVVGSQASAELDSELYDKFLNESSDE